VGGANSIRAFLPRSIGPGSYLPVSTTSGVLLDQTGDIQLVGNIENRFQLTRLFELALFPDAGNVWLARNDAARPGAQFDAATFYKQLAAGWGAGVRYLNPYFIIRVDIGYPLKLPNTTTCIGNWKKPVFNLAIGYPF
jgi:outer membrane protein insertion porin family